jgi:hypothetical protein
MLNGWTALVTALALALAPAVALSLMVAGVHPGMDGCIQQKT